MRFLTEILAKAGITSNYVQLDTLAATPGGAPGRIVWNDVDGTLEFQMKGGNVTQQIGQELPVLVKHADNTGLTNGKVVYQFSSDGSNVTVKYASASSETTASKTFGVMTEDATGGAKGFCTTFGYVRNINTSALTEGAMIWLSETPGEMTTTRPTQPAHGVVVGRCIRQHATEGVIFVSIQNGFELDELHDVLITSKANNDFIVYESATNLWKNKTISAVLGYTPANGANYLALTGGTLTGDLTLSGVNPRLYFTDTDNNPDYFISNTDGTFTVYDVTNSVGRFKIYSTGNAELNGNLSVGTSASSNKLLVYGGEIGTQIVFTKDAPTGAYGRLGQDSNGTFLTQNAKWDGSSWTRDNTGGVPMALALHNGNGRYEFRIAPNGTNPISWTIALAIESTGAATFASSISATSAVFSGAVSVASPFTIKDTNPYIQWKNASDTRLGYIQHATNLVMAADSGSIVLNTASGSFTLASSGTATFGANVSATNFRVYNGSTTGGYLIPKAGWVGSGTDYAPSIAAETTYGINFFTNGSASLKMYLATTGQLQLNTYTTATSYSGTAAGYLAFDSSGNVITVAGVAATDNTKLPLAGGTLTGNVTFGAGTRFPDTNGTIDSLWGVYGWDGQLQFTKRNISTDGYMGTAMFIDYGGLYVQSDYSFRAPIFYDSADTNYYIDANSNSNIATLTLNGNDNQLKIDSPTNGASGIFYRENGVNRWETYHYQGRLRFYSYVTNQEELSLDNSGGFLTSRTSMRAPIFYDSQDTNYYLDPNGTSRLYLVNAPQGYVSNGNPWSTADSAFFPNGITTAGSRNWIYGATYIGNAPGNGQGVDIGASGNAYFRSNVGTSSHGTSARFLEIQNANGNFIPYSFESEYGNHSWGTVMRIRINQSGADRPSIQFSSASNDTRWNVGYCYADDNFRVTQNMGYRNDNSTSDGWGTERFRINTDGNTYAAIGGTLYANGTQVVTNNGGTWNIAISGNSSTATRTSSQSGYGNAGTGMFPFYNWGGSNGGGGAPSDSTYTTGITVGSHPSDQAYGFQIANNMWNNGLWTRSYNSGWYGWVRLLDSSNYSSYALPLSGGTMTGDITYTNLRSSADSSYGFLGRNVYADTINGRGSDPLEINYYDGGDVRIGTGVNGSKGLYAGALYDAGSRVAISRGEGRQYVEYSRYVYNNGAYSGSGWIEPSDLGVRYAASANYASSAGSASSASHLPTAYVGGVQSNPQVYFNNGIGLKVAMTGHWSVWSDTMWVNGYAGGDVPWMCALHFLRNSEPRFAISAQTQGSGSYGSIYEVITSYNIANQTVSTANNLSGFDKTNPSFGAVYASNWFRAQGDCGLYSQDYGGHIRRALTGSYGNWETFGYNRNGWSGFLNLNNYNLNLMMNSSGDHGFYIENGPGWTFFFNRGNHCAGIGTDNTWSGDGLRVVKQISAEYGFTTWSDRRAKENITNITSALDKVLQMRGVYFNYIKDDAKVKRVGFIAQELQEVLPEVVNYADEIDEYNVNYGQIVSVLTEATKEQNDMIVSQATRIEQLELLVQQLINSNNGISN